MSAADQSQASAAIREMLHKANSLLLVSHIRPDGDAIGSLVGMGLALQSAGKSVQLILEDPIPARYRFLKGVEQIRSAPAAEFDLGITLDCSDLGRLEGLFKDRQVDINIDHHITNENFARVNLVYPQAVATCAILAEGLPQWSFALTVEAASALTMGLVTDTNGFRTTSVTPETMELAARLMRQGANLPEIYHQALINQSLQTSKLWGLTLAKLQQQDGLVWTSITLEDRKTSGYAGRDDAEITNFLTSVEGCRVAVLLNQQSAEKVKVSWRSRNHLDVSRLALKYGGGGHPNAAGAELTMPLPQAEQDILAATRKLIAGE